MPLNLIAEKQADLRVTDFGNHRLRSLYHVGSVTAQRLARSSSIAGSLFSTE